MSDLRLWPAEDVVTGEDPYDDPAYQAFVESAARECRNCSMCSEVPCGACLAGGICDQFRCVCNEDYDPFEDYDDREDED